MRDVILFTSEKMTQSGCYQILKKSFEQIELNGDGLLLNSKNRLYIDFSDERLLDDGLDDSKEMQKYISLENPYITYLTYYRLIDLQRIVNTLINYFSNLFIYIDDFNWFGSVEELNNELEKKKEERSIY